MSEPVMRDATAADFAVIYGHQPKVTMRAWVADLDGNPVGIAGILFHQGQNIMFSKMTDALKPYRRFIVRAARAVVERSRHYRPVAVADSRLPGAPKLLAHAGLVSIGHSSSGEMFQCPTA